MSSKKLKYTSIKTKSQTQEEVSDATKTPLMFFFGRNIFSHKPVGEASRRVGNGTGTSTGL